MIHAEDAQPNESTGRPKRILPFVKNTSRKEFKGRNNHTHRGHKPKAKATGSGFTTFGISHTSSSRASGSAPGPLSHPLPPKPLFTQTHNPRDAQLDGAGAAKTPSCSTPSLDPIPSRSHRWKFRPKTQPRSIPNERSISHNTESSSSGQQPVSIPTTSLHIDGPPAKRRRLAPTPDLDFPAVPTVDTVKAEETPYLFSEPRPGQVTSGTKFISYDKYPKCRFGCGKEAQQVRSNRSSIKGLAVAELKKQGLVIGAVHVRDDGIAIDWSLPDTTELPAPVAPASDLSPTVSRKDLCLPPSQQHDVLVSSDQTSLSYPAPSSPERPTASLPADTGYREILVPSQILPLHGDTRNLEAWVLEQMRLLETELGSIIIPPPELIGVGEYLIGEQTSAVKPCVRIRYQRPLRSGLLPQYDYPAENDNSYNSLPSPANHTVSQTDTPPSHDFDSPTHPDDFAIEVEKDELALNPPSPCPMPNPVLPDISCPNPIIQVFPVKGEPSGSTALSGVEPLSHAASAEVEELQRLRRDLEVSRQEAEQRHKDLERRILELSQRHTTVNSDPPTPSVDYQGRIADESKSNLIVLRRGKYDKTRRLLSLSESMVLHVSWLGMLQLINQTARQIAATGFENKAPDVMSVEDACVLSESSVALAFSGDNRQLAIATLGKKNFKYSPLPGHPHDAKGICAVVPVNHQEVLTLGNDHCYMHWRFNRDLCSTTPLTIPKFHQCTALAYEPINDNIFTAGSDSGKRSKLGVCSLHDSQRIPTTVDISNHVNLIHTDVENPSLIVLELARLDDQFEVRDIRMPIYHSVQKFGYQTVVYEKAAFRTRGYTRGSYFSRGDVGIVRVWDRRNLSSFQTIDTVPQQKAVDVTLNSNSLVCATESHHVVSYPML